MGTFRVEKEMPPKASVANNQLRGHMTKKDAILRAAVHLFAEKGYDETPTSEVAKRAGVAEGTIFHHFKSKEGILMHILEEMMEIYLIGIKDRARKANNGLEALEEIIRFHFRLSEERSREFLVLIRDFPFSVAKPGSPSWEAIWSRFLVQTNLMKECIERGQRDGSIRELPIKETALIIRGMLNGLVRLRLLGPVEMPDLASEVIHFCRHSLAK